MKTVILGFSGGVDSAVCAVLLRKCGYDVKGIYLDNTDEAARKSAEDAAAFIGIPLTVIDVRQELEEKSAGRLWKATSAEKRRTPASSAILR